MKEQSPTAESGKGHSSCPAAGGRPALVLSARSCSQPLPTDLLLCIYVLSLGNMQVLSESGIASGVRRIEAAAGPAAVEYVNSIDGAVKQMSQQLKAKPEELPGRVAGECHRCPCSHIWWDSPQDRWFCRVPMHHMQKTVSKEWMISVDGC